MTDLLLRVVLPMGLAGTLCYLLLLPLRPLFVRLKAGWKRTALLGCAALFLLPLPLLALLPIGQQGLAAAPTPVYSVGKALGQAARTPAVSPAAPLEEEPAQAAPALPRAAAPGAQAQFPGPLASPDLPRLAAALYGAGAAAALAVCALRGRRLTRQLNCGAHPETDAETLALCAGLCRELGIKRAPALLVCGGITAPVLAGVWRSRILLPEEEMRPAALRFALRHELCHHKNADLVFQYLLLLVGVLHWYSPVAHLLRRDFAEACEQACDEAVTARLVPAERKNYAATLLAFAGSAARGPVTAFASPAGRLQARLRRLMAPARPRRALRAACFALVCPLLALALLAGCSLAAGASDGASPGSVPDLGGMTRSEALQAVSNAGLTASAAASTESAPPQSSSIPADPAAKIEITAANTLALGDAVPDYAGLKFDEIFLFPDEDGVFTPKAHERFDPQSGEAREMRDLGVVIAQKPAAGETLLAWPIEITVRVPSDASSASAGTDTYTYIYAPGNAEKIGDTPGPGELLVPAPKAEYIIRRFGDGHRGLDFSGEAGEPVVAAAAGTVLEAGWHYSYGNYAVIAHGKLRTLYAHCETVLVEKGQGVEAGEEIATVGNTGNSSGTHCHLEVIVDEVLADPEDYLTLPPELELP